MNAHAYVLVNNIVFRGDGGRQGIVGRVNASSSTNSKAGKYAEIDMNLYADENETNFFFLMTRHVSRLTDPERDDLGEMFCYMLLAQGDNNNGQTLSLIHI